MGLVKRALVQIQLPSLNVPIFQHKDFFFENFGKTKNNTINAEAEKVLWYN